MAEHEMKIVLTDETSDGRFLKSNTADNIAKTATETKTEKVVTGGSTPSAGKEILNKIGSNAFETATHGLSGKLMGIASNPVTIATTALALANKAYNKFREMEKAQNVWQNQVMLRAGGERGNVNQLNLRTDFITGRVGAERQKESRR